MTKASRLASAIKELTIAIENKDKAAKALLSATTEQARSAASLELQKANADAVIAQRKIELIEAEPN